MVRELMPDSLAVAKDERHRMQEQVVDMIEAELRDVETALQTEIADTEAKIRQEEEGKAGLEAEVAKVAVGAETILDATTKKKEHLAGESAALKAAREAMLHTKATQSTGDKDLVQAEELRVAFEAALQVLTPLAEGASDADLEKAKRQTGELLVLAQTSNLDESMAAALPTALSQDPATRGQFDTMVLKTFRSEVSKSLEETLRKLQEGEPAKTARAAAVQAAADDEAAAMTRLRASAAVFREALAAQEASEAALAAAREPVTAKDKEVRQLRKDMARSNAQLAHFRDGPLAAFLDMRERVEAAPAAAETESAPGLESEAEAAEMEAPQDAAPAE